MKVVNKMKRIRFIIISLLFVLFLASCELNMGGDKQKEEANEFSVTILDEDGNLVEEAVVKKGEAYEPKVAPQTGYYYDYGEYNDDLENVVENLNVVRYITEMDKSVYYYIDGAVYYQYSGKYYDPVDDPALPSYMARAYWHREIEKTATSITYIYTLESYTTKSLTVKFMLNGKLVETQSVEYGSDATYPTFEERMHVTWDKECTNITDNTVINGVATYDYLTITYYVDGNVANLAPSSFTPGEEVTLPTPEKENYVFDGWYASDISLYPYKDLDGITTHDVVLYARFRQINNDMVIELPQADYHFASIKKVNIGNNATGYQPQIPSGPSQSVTAYKWTTSDSKILTVSEWSTLTAHQNGFCVLTATSTDGSTTINAFVKVTSEGIFIASADEVNSWETIEVTFKGLNDEIIEVKTIRKGTSTFYPIPPVVEGYRFIGWDQEIYDLEEDTTIIALYESGEASPYQGKKIAFIGDSISTYQYYIPSGYAFFYPYPAADVYNVNQTWWMEVVNQLGAGLFINNSYSGSCVASGASSDSSNATRLAKLSINGETPDVVIIYMGSNDAHAKFSKTKFASYYEYMITQILDLCPNVEIVLATLCKSKLYDEDTRASYNSAITSLAEKYDFKIVDLAAVDISNSLVDSAHPNKAGMLIISEKIVADLLN